MRRIDRQWHATQDREKLQGGNPVPTPRQFRKLWFAMTNEPHNPLRGNGLVGVVIMLHPLLVTNPMKKQIPPDHVVGERSRGPQCRNRQINLNQARKADAR